MFIWLLWSEQYCCSSARVYSSRHALSSFVHNIALRGYRCWSLSYAPIISPKNKHKKGTKVTVSWQSHITADNDMSFSQEKGFFCKLWAFFLLLHLSFLKGFGLILNLNLFLFQHEHLDLTTPHLRQLHSSSYKLRSSVTVFTLNSMGGEALDWLWGKK